MKTIFLIGILALFTHQTLAQVRNDPYYFNAVTYNGKKDHVYEMGVTAPPIRFGKNMWINSIASRQLQVTPEESSGFKDSILASEHRLSSTVRTQIDEKWSAMAGVGLSYRGAQVEMRPSKNSAFTSGYVMFTKVLDSNPNARVVSGFAIPDRSNPNWIFPVLGYDYEFDDKSFRFQIGFPVTSMIYTLSEDTRLGLLAIYDSGSYYIDTDSHLRAAQAEYLRSERLIAAGLIRHRLFSKIFGTLRLGATLKSQVKLQNFEFTDLRELSHEGGIYVAAGLSFAVE